MVSIRRDISVIDSESESEINRAGVVLWLRSHCRGPLFSNPAWSEEMFIILLTEVTVEFETLVLICC